MGPVRKTVSDSETHGFTRFNNKTKNNNTQTPPVDGGEGECSVRGGAARGGAARGAVGLGGLRRRGVGALGLELRAALGLVLARVVLDLVGADLGHDSLMRAVGGARRGEVLVA